MSCLKLLQDSTGTRAIGRNANGTAYPLARIEALIRRGPHVAPDPSHSAGEDRFIAVGRTVEGRPLFVAFTFRTKDGNRLIRPVSARCMHGREIEGYEAESS